ncbi:hypothetical protein GT037_004381 [Alternaria burnsii]|uniref:BTB domain-containing protein n=1 Tax=Alternaria burnsii TaxID=1187904 RepID=A0A8H7B8V5_9PLEO|nr:uncharacterized protein GT037_004381 [Alternaria burnsii]KAF7677522.1 hypothetical protein GT037_004381 [Alternaria burnsii]
MGEPSTACSFEELVQSKLFTFYVGKEKKAFVVHSQAIAATSWHFHALVNNGMAQSQEGSVEYPDMDPCDFARYVEYAYRYDYTVPKWALDVESSIDEPDTDVSTTGPVEVEEPPPPPPEEPEDNSDDQWDYPTVIRMVSVFGHAYAPKRKKSKKSLNLRRRFNAEEYLTSNEPKTKAFADCIPKENTEHEQDFTPVFLAHVRLYTFACMRLIDPLKRLALHKLHQTLLKFKLYDRRVGDVVELARYAYDHGEDRKSNGTIEDLRKLVVEYIACEVSIIGKHKAFAPLLQEGGEFVVDFWGIIAKENLGLYA